MAKGDAPKIQPRTTAPNPLQSTPEPVLEDFSCMSIDPAQLSYYEDAAAQMTSPAFINHWCFDAEPEEEIIPQRSDIPEELKWNLADIYPTDAAWEKAYKAIKARVDAFSTEWKEAATASGQKLFEAMENYYDLKKEVIRIEYYGHLRSDEDTRVSDATTMKMKGTQLMTTFNANTAFLRPAILSLDAETIAGYQREEPRLAKYETYLRRVLEERTHTLSMKEEKLLADRNLITNGAFQAYQSLCYADMKHPKATLSDGSTVEVTIPNYVKLRSSTNRTDRVATFQAFWKNYGNFKNTFASMLNTHVQARTKTATERTYGSALEMAFDKTDVDPKAYDALIAGVHEGLPALHRYLKLRKKLLGLETLGYEDLYAPLAKSEKTYTIEEGKQLFLDSLAPLGENYVTQIEKAFDERWADFMPSEGKYPSGYMAGEVYDAHPYVMLNWNGSVDSVSTMAHEFGHAMHSWYTNTTQPFAYADYKIFVAEVPSTTNEILLAYHMIDQTDDPKEKLYMYGQVLESLRTTVFRQTQFAEFEGKIYDSVQKGEPLTADLLGATYGDLLKEYYGADKGITDIDDTYNVEWTLIHHFFKDFYVYNYATSFVAGLAIAKKMREGDTAARDRFIEALKLGESKDPVDILKVAGIDMTTTEPYKAAWQEMNYILGECEKLAAEIEN